MKSLQRNGIYGQMETFFGDGNDKVHSRTLLLSEEELLVCCLSLVAALFLLHCLPYQWFTLESA